MALTPKHFGLQSGPMIHFGDIASALVAPDPVDHVGRVMGRLMEHIAAKAGAVVAPDEDGDTRVIAARNVSLESIEAIASLWRRSVKALEAGRICGREGQRLIPLIDDGKLVGAVYIESSQAIPDLGAYGTILARAVRVAIDPFASAEVGADLLGIGAEESKREITLATLRQHEWNISRVARELGLTRRTIYLRLARWGVTREKVSKTPRRLAVEEA